jgi:hypothetical protein
VVIGRIGSSSVSVGSGRISLTKKIVRSWVGFELGFRSNTIGFFGSRVISGRISGYYEFRSFWTSSHSGPGRVEFLVRVGSSFGSSDIG